MLLCLRRGHRLRVRERLMVGLRLRRGQGLRHGLLGGLRRDAVPRGLLRRVRDGRTGVVLRRDGRALRRGGHRSLDGRRGRPRPGAAVGRCAVRIGLVQRLWPALRPRLRAHGRGGALGWGEQMVLGIRGRLGHPLRGAVGRFGDRRAVGTRGNFIGDRRQFRRLLLVTALRYVGFARYRASRCRAAPPLRLGSGGLPVVHALPAPASSVPRQGHPCRDSTRFTNVRAGTPSRTLSPALVTDSAKAARRAVWARRGGWGRAWPWGWSVRGSPPAGTPYPQDVSRAPPGSG